MKSPTLEMNLMQRSPRISEDKKISIPIREHAGELSPGINHKTKLLLRPPDFSNVMESSLYEKPRLKRDRTPQEWMTLSKSMCHKVQLPVTQWLFQYKKQDLFFDLQAGLVVGVLLIPQGMAYGVLASLTPIYGLYCAIVPNITYALLGTSRESAVGAAALVSIMLGDAIISVSPNPHPHIEERVNIAVKLAFLTGIIQFFLGMMKMGEVASYVSHPVMVGFCSGGEILIAVAQLKYLFGIKVPQYPFAIQTILYLCNHIKETKPWTFLLGVVTFMILFSISRWRRRQKAKMEANKGQTPSRALKTVLLMCNFGPFVAIIITSFLSYGMHHWGVGPQIVGKVPQGLHTFASYAMTMTEFQTMFPRALILAVIGFMLTFSVSLKYASLARYTVNPSQELVALGVSNNIGSLFGAFPVAGGFARTAVNVEAGARTQASSFVSAGIVILAVSLLTKFFYWIPQSTLAAIVQVAICSIMDFKPYAYAYRTSKSEFLIMSITFLVTLGLGVDKGIMAGVGLSILALIRLTSHTRLKVVGRLPGTQTFRDITRYPNAEQPPGILILRTDESLNFASCASIKEQIIRAASGKDVASPASDVVTSGSPQEITSMMAILHQRPNYVILDCSGMNHIDLSGIRALEEVHESLTRGEQSLYMVNVKSNVRDKLKGTPLFKKVGAELIFLALPTLVNYLISEMSKKEKGEGGEEEEELAFGASNWII